MIKERSTPLFLLHCLNSLSNTNSLSYLPHLSRIPSRLSPVRCFTCNAKSPPFVPLSPDLPHIPAPGVNLVSFGCDYKHWLIVMDYPYEGMSREDIIDHYVKTLTSVVASEEEARKMIYSVSTRCYYAFGALMSRELSDKMRELKYVRSVLADSYLDVDNKDYGGEPFVNGKAVPYDPKYHERWMRNQNVAAEYRGRPIR